MKKILLVTFAAMMLASVSFAVGPFSPTPIELEVQPIVQYDFDGSEVEFTVGVSGQPARVYLWINTQLSEDALPIAVQNGPRGWHYVNKIDTTVYVSGYYDLPIGDNNKISWDGMGSENTGQEYGGTYEASSQVEAGTYDYYVWGYDNNNNRTLVCNFIPINFYWRPQFTKFIEFNDDGTPRTQPLMAGNVHVDPNYKAEVVDGVVVGPMEGHNSYGPPRFTAFKFKVGSDPDDYQFEYIFHAWFLINNWHEVICLPYRISSSRRICFLRNS
jgi:hypothetical protein